ncbi:MAG: hypothetical protein J6U36_05000, partial [Oscillospiraceae bacterium]|nr:hypothetical protein [Oscillospiraceae bacterium]
MMDIKRSDRLRKTAAIAALVLAINSTGATAELGTTGFWSGNIVNAVDSENEEIVFHYINTGADFEKFVNETFTDGKTHVAQFTEKAEEVEVKGGYDTLSAGKVIYGDGSTLKITGNNALFNTIKNGAR